MGIELMNWLVGTILILFIAFLALKGRLGVYASMLFYTPPSGSGGSSTAPSTPSTSSGTNGDASNSLAPGQKQPLTFPATPFPAINGILKFFGG